MLLPFAGVFFSLALWGTFFPVPMLSDPSESFVRRISGAMHATTLAKGVYDLVELISAYTKPRHDGAVYLPVVVPDGYGEHVDFPNTVTALSVVIPLWEEAEEPTCPAGSGPASTSPMPSRVVSVLAGYLAFVLSLGACAYTLGNTLKVQRSRLEPSPKVAHHLGCMVKPALVEALGAMSEQARYSCLVYADSDNGSPTSSETAGMYIYIHTTTMGGDVFFCGRWRQVEAIILPTPWSRRYPELDICTRKGQTASADAADVSLTKPAPDASDVAGSSSSACLPRQWALVVRRLESLSPVLVYQLLCALLTSWERHSALVAAPVSADQQAGEESDHGAEVTTTSGGRRKRPSQAKRRRAAWRALREKQEELIAEFERTTRVYQPLLLRTLLRRRQLSWGQQWHRRLCLRTARDMGILVLARLPLLRERTRRRMATCRTCLQTVPTAGTTRRLVVQHELTDGCVGALGCTSAHSMHWSPVAMRRSDTGL